MLSGEAGIGKTRLAEELLHWAGQQGFTTAAATCYAAEGELIYSPIVTWLRSPSLQIFLTVLDPIWLTEVAHLMPEVRIVRPDLPPPLPQAEAMQRTRLFEALGRAILTAPQPILLLIDDLQWCDRTTLEWLRYVLHAEPRARLLLLGTFRLEEVDATHPLVDLLGTVRATGQLTEIALDRLDTSATAALAAQLIGQALCPAQASALYRETEGNALFVVETMRAQLGGQQARAYGEPASVHPVGTVVLPPRIYAVIAARLAKLSPLATELVGLAATIGRSFSFNLLRRAGTFDDDALVRGLDELWQHWIIREQGAQCYDFSHDKLREVAYTQLSEARRRRWHVRIAEALEELIGNQPDRLHAQVATHYEQANYVEQAIRAYQRAAEAAQQLYAFTEAVALYQRALGLLAHVRPHRASPTAIELEVERHIHEGLGHNLARAEQHVEARHAYARARALTPEADVLGRARLQRAIGNSWCAQGFLDEAEQAYARALRSLSERPQQQEDPLYWQEMIAVYFDQINLQLWQGGQGEATKQCLTSLDWILERHGAPPQIAHAAHLALVAEWWRCSGSIDTTFLARSERALQLCETCGDRWLAARACWNIGMMQVLHGDAARADELLQMAIVDTEQVGDVQLHVRGLVVVGLLARRRGQVDTVHTNALTYLLQAQQYDLHDCVGAGYADLAWAAWHTEDPTRAEEHARHALTAWRASTIAYPLQWTALWPLVAVTLATDQVGEAIRAARHLLHPLQHRPPEPLATMLCAAISAYEQDQPDGAHAHMQTALSEAQTVGLL